MDQGAARSGPHFDEGRRARIARFAGGADDHFIHAVPVEVVDPAEGIPIAAHRDGLDQHILQGSGASAIHGDPARCHLAERIGLSHGDFGQAVAIQIAERAHRSAESSLDSAGVESVDEGLGSCRCCQ